jgi:hypothetical protein
MHYVRHRKTDDWQEHGQGTYSVRLLPKTREQVKAAVLGSATTAEQARALEALGREIDEYVSRQPRVAGSPPA